jgi:hypothetical protein
MKNNWTLTISNLDHWQIPLSVNLSTSQMLDLARSDVFKEIIESNWVQEGLCLEVGEMTMAELASNLHLGTVSPRV